MYVSDWMTKKVFTVKTDDSISTAIRLLKEKKIKHLPVMGKNDKLVGILSDRDIKEYTPSKASTFDIHELNYILFTTKVKEIMVKGVVTASPKMAVEEAAMIMYDRNIGCLPVIDDAKLEGIISDRDLFRVLIDITGVRHKGHRFYVHLEDKLGATKEVIDIVRESGFLIDSVLTTYEGVDAGFKRVVVRTKGPDGNIKKARKSFEEKYGHHFFPF